MYTSAPMHMSACTHTHTYTYIHAQKYTQKRKFIVEPNTSDGGRRTQSQGTPDTMVPHGNSFVKFL